ncbi:MAG: cyclase [Planctomycetales bacterium 12-60-4]|nr:MAG: cyclase [Planctomycetales bacterium 12-60-4]
MKGAVSVVVAMTGAGLVAALIVATVLHTTSAAPPSVVATSPFAGQQIVDLTYNFNPQTPYWPGEKYKPFELTTIATLEQDGVLSKAISLPEHLGTHLDAPNHFEPNQPSVDAVRPADLVGPGIVIDLHLKAETDADAVLTLADVRAWEARHGTVPKEAIIFLHTGWGRFWSNNARYMNRDAAGKLHFPAYSADAARYLIVERAAKGLGIDTLSIDPGISKDFAVHHIVNGAGRYGIENVAHLDKLPPQGFMVVVSPMKIENGTGGPTRIFAFVPQVTP